MATDYTKSSFQLPAEWLEEAKDDFKKIIKVCQDFPETETNTDLPEGYSQLGEDLDWEFLNVCNGVVWEEHGALGYYDMESFDAMNIPVIVQAIADKYKIQESQACFISWACTCSSPRVSHFSGDHRLIYYAGE